nr:hypothetical protein [Dongshaea marina]
MPVAELVTALLADWRAGKPVSLLAVKFHHTLAELSARLLKILATQTGVEQLVLTGGVFQNRLLAELMIQRLIELDLKPWLSEAIPANDGGIALGQAVIAGR